MIDLPDWAKEQFPDGYEVVWAERRAVFEIVSEVAESVYLVLAISTLGAWISWFFRYGHPVYWVGVGLFCIYAMRIGFEEYKRWQYEMHVIIVAQGISYYYKFSGWLDRNPVHETITAVSPNGGVRQKWYERLWGWATGEHMGRITLNGASGTHLNARRIDPSFDKALQNVRAGKKNTLPDLSAEMRDANEISRLLDGKKLDPDVGLPAIETIVREKVWGRL